MAEVLKIAGAVAGLGGLALAVFLLIARPIIEKLPRIPSENSAKIVTLLLWLSFILCALGLGTYATIELSKQKGLPNVVLPKPKVEVVARNPAGIALQVSFPVTAIPSSVALLLEVSADSGFDERQQLLLQELHNWERGDSLQVQISNPPDELRRAYVRLRGWDAAGEPIAPSQADSFEVPPSQ